MILTLEVVGEQAEALGSASRKVFDSIGGTIGRLPDNDWVFPDPYVSGRHALVRYLEGKFFIEDTSTNGVFVNSLENRVPRAQAYPLKHGDLLYIDAYRIQVSIQKNVKANAQDRDPFELLAAAGRGSRFDNTVAMQPQRKDDHTVGMNRDSDEPAVEWLDADDEDFENSPTTSKKAQPAAPAKPLPPPPPVKSPPPPPRSAAQSERKDAARADDLMRELLSAAGMSDVQPSSDLARTLGELLRVAIAGSMEALRARERMKDDMRLRGTSFKAQDNNPLKFSANVDDAFHNMFVKNHPAYLTPPDALDDALRDVRNHQAALAAATRVAFEALLSEFEPNRLQDEFDRQVKKGAILGVPAKLRYWDLYREKYGETIKDTQASFRKLLSDELAKAYEDHLARLQALSRARGK